MTERDVVDATDPSEVEEGARSAPDDTERRPLLPPAIFDDITSPTRRMTPEARARLLAWHQEWKARHNPQPQVEG